MADVGLVTVEVAYDKVLRKASLGRGIGTGRTD
jgi:hypothetical protein